jgi:glutaredoxin
MKNFLTLIVLAGLLIAGWNYRDNLTGLFTTAGTNTGETPETPSLNLPDLLPKSPSATPHPASESQAQAKAIYPGLAKPDSPLNKKFVALYREAQANDPALLTRPDWPIELADRAIVSLGGTPMSRNANTSNAAAATSVRPSAKKVVIYTTTNCPYCANAKQYLDKKGVRFREVNIATSIAGMDEYRKLGGRGTPLIMVGNEKVENFSESTLDQLLQ